MPDSSIQQDKERYHLASCAKYEALRGIYPNNRRLTGKDCSCGLEARDRDLDRRSRVDELKKLSTVNDWFDLCQECAVHLDVDKRIEELSSTEKPQ